MGQLRQAHCSVGVKPGFTIRSKMLPPLVVGFTCSAMLIFALAHLAGSAFRSSLPFSVDLLFLLPLVVFAAIDLSYPRVRPTLVRRQTPRSLAGRFSLPMTGFLWGLDTGSMLSTFRASAASWSALVLCFAGWGPWWTGIVYSAGFCLPLAALIATYPVAGPADGEHGWRYRSTESVVSALFNALNYIRLTSAVVALAAVTVVLAGATP
jgi:hypothetical protein